MNATHSTEIRLQLDDGIEILIADITPEAAPLLVEGMQHLSATTRRQRFLGPKQTLSPREIDYLVNCDGHDHIGLGACTGDSAGSTREPIGVARCVRDEQDPTLAEAAVVVVDRWQGRGIGSILMRALAERAMAEGISGFRGTYMADNLGIRRLIASFGIKPEQQRSSSGEVDVVFPLRRSD